MPLFYGLDLTSGKISGYAEGIPGIIALYRFNHKFTYGIMPTAL